MMGRPGVLKEGRGCNEQSLVALVGSVHAAGGSQPLPASPPAGLTLAPASIDSLSDGR